MSIFEAILLGLVQGLTEFLPISSSGHLVIFQQIFNVKEASMAFDVALHLGTLVAVFIFYWEDISLMLKEFFLWIGELIGKNKPAPGDRDNGHRIMMFMLILATIPTAIIGLIFNNFIEKLFSSMIIIGFTLLITGLFLWISNKMTKGKKEAKNITSLDAVSVGFMQGLAITPGISRSGTTIFAGMLRGFDIKLATKFSFLLSIPAILGAGVLEGAKVIKAGEGFPYVIPTLIGTAVAAVSGYFAIKFLVNLINKRKLHYFSFYCWGAGILIILYSIIG